KNRRHHRPQHEDRLFADVLLGEGLDDRRDSFVFLGMILSDAGADGLELAPRLSHRYSGLEPPHDFELIALAPGKRRGIHGPRQPQLRQGGEEELARHDPHDFVDQAVGPNRLADDGGVAAEAVLRDVPTDDGDRRSPWPVVVFGKEPSPKWLNPKQLESGCGDEPALETLRSPLQPAYIDRSLGPGGQVLEALLLLPPGGEIADRNAVAVDATTRARSLEMKNLAGMLEGKPPEDAAPHDAPHRGSEAQAHGEGEDRDHGEAGMLGQHPKAMLQVGEEGAHLFTPELCGDHTGLRRLRRQVSNRNRC